MTTIKDRAHRASTEAAARNPAPGAWGFFCTADGPHTRDAGIAGFRWFDSRDEMLLFVREQLVLVIVGLGHRESARLVAGVRPLITAVTRRQIDQDDARKDLNLVLKDLLRITWWGTFEDLCHGDSHESRRVRKWFRQGRDVPRPDAPLTASEVETLAQRLWEYAA